MDLPNRHPGDAPVLPDSVDATPKGTLPAPRNIDPPVVVVVGSGSYHSMVARHLREALLEYEVVVLNDTHIAEPPGRRLNDLAEELFKETFIIRASGMDRHLPVCAETRPRNNPWYRQHAGRRSWD